MVDIWLIYVDISSGVIKHGWLENGTFIDNVPSYFNLHETFGDLPAMFD